MPSQSASLTGNGQACPSLGVDAGKSCDISIRGTFSATVALQRSFDLGATWGTIASYTTPTETTYIGAGDCLLQLITTAFSSGSVTARIGY